MERWYPSAAAGEASCEAVRDESMGHLTHGNLENSRSHVVRHKSRITGVLS